MRSSKPFRLFIAFLLCACAVPTGVAQQSGEWGRRPVYGPLGVEVLVAGRPLEVFHARGRRYVEALEGEEYVLRVRNPLPVRVAVALSVDGLNTIDARRTSSWHASKWVVEPYQTIHISGWQMSSSRARRFYFTTERDSYAARLGRASDLGVITAVFYREQSGGVVTPAPREDDSSRVEPLRRSRDGEKQRSGRGVEWGEGRSSGAMTAPAPKPDDEHAATGIGRSVQHDVTWINMRLEQRPVAEVSIRYEYRDALLRLGILPRPIPYNDWPPRRRERARGFEDPRYSPEP